MFDWTLNVGHVLIFVSFIGTAIGMFFATKTEVARAGDKIAGLHDKLGILGGRVINVENKIDTFGTVLVAIARQEERLVAQERRMNEMDRVAHEWRTWALPRLALLGEAPP